MRVASIPGKSGWNGRCRSAIWALRFTPSVGSQCGTYVTTSAKATSPYLGTIAYRPPEAPICVTQLISVRAELKSPLRITIRGVVAELSDMQFTDAQTRKRTFIIIDDAGMFIRCNAIGLPATSRALENASEIIGYFGTGRKPGSASPGAILFLNDSLIVQLNKRIVMPVKRAEISVT